MENSEMLKVLLVEDDMIVQLVHKRILKDLGCLVDIADRGDVALEMSQESYDVIFMDIGLPRMSGIDVIKNIRERDDETSDTYIIALTGYIGDEERQACLEAGANAVETKPIKFDKLQEILEQFKVNC